MITENRVIDLGLPSGTLWTESNEDGFYTFDEAVAKYGDSLPTREQFEELKNQCKWGWMGDGYKVTGPNGNYIVLPAGGYRSYDGSVDHVNFGGHYWSSTLKDSVHSLFLNFYSSCVGITDCHYCHGFSIRLVK